MSKLQNPTKLFPMFVTDALAQTKAFYVETLGWTATYDMDGYLQVRSADEEGPELCFMSREGLPRFEGKGVIVSVPVADADAHFKALCAKGVEAVSEPAVKPWGWRSFMVADPNGLLLDFFHVAEAPTMQPTG